MAGKGKQIRLNSTDKNQEQADFVHKPNQHLIIEFDCWIIYFMNGLLNQQTKSFFH